MSKFVSLTKSLKKLLDSEYLPDLAIQKRMSPITRKMHKSTFNSSIKPRKSAILILFYPVNDKPHIVLMKRAPDNSVHSRQISFPGGKVEEFDRSLIDTALREANEEVGVNSDDVKVIGQLSKLYIPPSNFDVFPIVGYSETRPKFITNNEVDQLLEVNISDLLVPDNCTYKTIRHGGNEFVVPCYYIQNQIIWGATAMIMSELLELVDLGKGMKD